MAKQGGIRILLTFSELADANINRLGPEPRGDILLQPKLRVEVAEDDGETPAGKIRKPPAEDLHEFPAEHPVSDRKVQADDGDVEESRPQANTKEPPIGDFRRREDLHNVLLLEATAVQTDGDACMLVCAKRTTKPKKMLGVGLDHRLARGPGALQPDDVELGELVVNVVPPAD